MKGLKYMQLDYKKYLDKVKGCYTGKNIGGTLGAPFECYRGVYNLDWFMQDITSPIPNDDVDLQLVWLAAVEREGRHIDSLVLAEYWETYETPCVAVCPRGYCAPEAPAYRQNVHEVCQRFSATICCNSL